MRPVTKVFPSHDFPIPLSPTTTTCGLGMVFSLDHGLKYTGLRLKPEEVQPRKTPLGVPMTPLLACKKVEQTELGRFTAASSEGRGALVGSVLCQLCSCSLVDARTRNCFCRKWDSK